jgi:sulfur carrier protein
MEILLNGQPCRTGEGATLDELLREQGLAERRVAIEVNGEMVPRGLRAERVLRAADRVEIVHALGGG